MPSENYLPRFATRQIETAGARIHLATGGSGAPLLLLHGHPQTHLTWHKIAPRLAKRFTVVAPDLRGYGDSAKPDGGERITIASAPWQPIRSRSCVRSGSSASP